MMPFIDKRILNVLIIFLLSIVTFSWTSFIFHVAFDIKMVGIVFGIRLMSSLLIYKDYSLSWSKVTQKTFLLKSLVYIVAFCIYMPFYYGDVRIAFLASELFLFLFSINFIMYTYYFFTNLSGVKKSKSVVIFGAGKAGLRLESEFKNSVYKVKYFIDDNAVLQKRSIDAIQIISKTRLKKILENRKYDLLVIAIPSATRERINEIYDELHDYFNEIQILPSLDTILTDKSFSAQLKDVSVEDLLARRPQDLDKKLIESFVQGKVILVTGAGGSIGSEIVRQCIHYSAKKIILLDHSEYNLYALMEEIQNSNVELIPIMDSVVNKSFELVFSKYPIDIVIHAAAYKHVPLVEDNIMPAIKNNILGTKNCIDLSIKYKVKNFVMISTDKAVRPTNVMGATKRICELYAQNVQSNETRIVAVRFGNVLGSSGSVIPKFKKQIEEGKPLTVTDPEITRYFMLIPEACELVLQAASLGSGGEIFILDMGEPVKIVDLAKKLIDLSGRKDIEIQFTGLRPGEKLYEELLIDETDKSTQYDSITIAKSTNYNIDVLNSDIQKLTQYNEPLEILAKIVPEFKHKFHNYEGKSNAH